MFSLGGFLSFFLCILSKNRERNLYLLTYKCCVTVSECKKLFYFIYHLDVLTVFILVVFHTVNPIMPLVTCRLPWLAGCKKPKLLLLWILVDF